MKKQGRGGEGARDEFSERRHEDDAASAVGKVRRRGPARVRRAPSICSSVRGSSVAVGGLRLRRASQLAGGRRRGPSTPVPSWKLVGDADNAEAVALGRHPDSQQHPHYHLQPERPSASIVSARRLAAALWELQAVPFGRGGARHSGDDNRRHHSTSLANEKNSALLSQPQSPASSCAREMLFKQPLSQDKMERALPAHHPSSSMKALLKDLAQGPMSSNEFVKVLNHVRTLEEQHRSSTALVDKLHRELDQSRSKLQELLQREKDHSVEVEKITKKLVEERTHWQERQEENVRLAMHSAQEEIYQERKARSRLESLHRRLAKEFQELKKALGKALHDLERERKARELMEDVCDELAREIGEDKARVEEMKRESAKVREEVEEERKMLQMAEIWREERVQMKLMEAKLELEEKNAALDKLRGELEAFLKAKRAGNLGHHTSTEVRHDEHSGHTQEAIVGHNLADPFHSRDARVPARHSTDSRPSNPSGQKQNVRDFDEEDDGSSVCEDDLHSIAISNDMHAKQEAPQRSRFQHGQRDGDDREKHSIKEKVSSSEKYRQMQGSSSYQVLQRSKSSQQHSRDHYSTDAHGTSWVEDNAECREWTGGHTALGGEETVNTWPSEIEGSQVCSSYSPMQTGIAKNEPQVDSNNLESSGTNAAWLRQIVESSRDLPATSVFAPMQKQLYAKSSPTRHWNHFWSSPDPGSPRRAKSKGLRETPGVVRDNSLKAKLLEAKLEGEHARYRGEMG